MKWIITEFTDDTLMEAIKKYNLVFFDTFSEARSSKDRILELAKSSEQVNVVIREEGNMDDSELLALNTRIKIFAGKAWASIHERRLTDGWYDGAALTGISPTLDLHL